MMKKQMRCTQVRLAHKPDPFFITAFSVTVKTMVGKNDASWFCCFGFRMSVLNQLEVNLIISSSCVTNCPCSQYPNPIPEKNRSAARRGCITKPQRHKVPRATSVLESLS